MSRLKKALDDGVEICETILNYRRDGTPFMNLLMMAPLFDNCGQVRYFIGCQVDVSGLIEGGKGLDSLARLLAQRETEATNGKDGGGKDTKAMNALRKLSSILSLEESDVLKREPNGHASDTGSIAGSIHSASRAPGTKRRYLVMDEPMDRDLWTAPSLGRSGRLPGVYRNVSPGLFSLRTPPLDLVQAQSLTHI